MELFVNIAGILKHKDGNSKNLTGHLEFVYSNRNVIVADYNIFKRIKTKKNLKMNK